jgi:hypothetical protein
MNKFSMGIFPGRLEPDTTIAGCIDIFENAWPNPLETIEAIETECANPESDLHWSRASTIGEGVHQNVRTNYDLCLTAAADVYGNQLAKNIHNQMYFLLAASLAPYIDKYQISGEFMHEYYSVLKYSSGQKYDAHYDGGTADGRSISAIAYLNNDYIGGEIEFVNFGIKIKPEPGMLLLFPSNYAYKHIAHPIVEGTKYAIVTWIKDRWMQ